MTDSTDTDKPTPRVVWEHRTGEAISYRAVETRPGRRVYEISSKVDAMEHSIWGPLAVTHADTVLYMVDALFADYQAREASTPEPVTQPRDDALLRLVSDYRGCTAGKLHEHAAESHAEFVARMRAHPGIQEFCRDGLVSLWRPTEPKP